MSESEKAASTAKPPKAKLTPVEELNAALKAVDQKALAQVEKAMGDLNAAYEKVVGFVKVGHPPHAGHNIAFDKAWGFLNKAHGGAAQALDRFKGFASLHAQATKLYAEAQKGGAK